ncbi:hypothetical protein [Stratiformator vulcanicus]|uniref:Uncharacterized protein n=1 Tax=Stratiformator vulcanicus TaxID=2527980 RepID=A0A517R453_9PLAN|nr:hypothetical protein [Stratiformator vulcanicus]QDT38669.1 hypothetical protein Pan189_30650 [Stratiformator vulcanicus]
MSTTSSDQSLENKESPNKKRSGGRWLVAILVFVAICIGLVWLAGRATTIMRQDYAMAWSAELLVFYMQNNGDELPEDFRPLAKYHDILRKNKDARYKYPFSAMLKLVEYDFDVDVDQLRQETVEGGITHDVVKLKEGTPKHWFAPPPNEILSDYLGASDDSGDDSNGE